MTTIKKGTRTKKSTRGALIKGMSGKLPSEMLLDPVFKIKLKEVMKGFAGIYCLYNKHKLYYVGLTKNLFGRIKWHLRDRHKNRWTTFIIFRIKRIGYLKDIETLITHVMDLPGNRVKGRVPKDADLGRALRSVLKQHQKEINLFKKALK